MRNARLAFLQVNVVGSFVRLKQVSAIVGVRRHRMRVVDAGTWPMEAHVTDDRPAAPPPWRAFGG